MHSREGQPLPGILHGPREPIFEVLPQTVIANLRSPRSENARLWNLIYPVAQSAVDMQDLFEVNPLWGTVAPADSPDQLWPYFWGYAPDGSYLAPLRKAVLEVDGTWPGTEVDLCLVGSRNLILVEAKVTSRLGRCARYAASACPEIHRTGGECQYWAEGGVPFRVEMEFGERPVPSLEAAPVCHRHYQLGRTLLVGRSLSQDLGLDLHLWLLTPKRLWGTLKTDWADFAGRVRDPALWRRLRVVSWEELASLPRS